METTAALKTVRTGDILTVGGARLPVLATRNETGMIALTLVDEAENAMTLVGMPDMPVHVEPAAT